MKILNVIDISVCPSAVSSGNVDLVMQKNKWRRLWEREKQKQKKNFLTNDMNACECVRDDCGYACSVRILDMLLFVCLFSSHSFFCIHLDEQQNIDSKRMMIASFALSSSTSFFASVATTTKFQTNLFTIISFAFYSIFFFLFRSLYFFVSL